ncbi:MAG: alanine dehydrogenase [Planctomycetota bacterium]|jgi:alanine dehydrogenase
MVIGTVKEIKRHEYRVGLTPDCVKGYVARGHRVLVQAGAGEDAGFEDALYEKAGAELITTAKAVFGQAEMIVKVKEPLPEEYDLLREGQLLFTYLHLAAGEELTRALLDRGVNSVAYETITTANGGLPCLKPMSEIAGRLAIQEGAKYLEKAFGGRGVLLAGVPGVPRGKVAIIGGGIVGLNACKIAVGMGADVTVLDISSDRLAYIDDIFATSITTLYSTDANIERVLRESDLVIGAVLLPGAKAPNLVRREHLSMMKKGAVIVDVAVDQGGCVETTKPTTHDEPTYTIDGVVHYCVANMPGSVALSSTNALTSTTTPYGLQLAEKGVEKACLENPALLQGLSTYQGKCTYQAVAETFGLDYTDATTALTA